ncbi:hypothetical protein FNF28_07581 [Cafeteria roenbergensis]|uniref:UBP-type domain-containing protein n=1 Tax=Cafeteria roenbergensis TaxID=33653 RepID=A0A5A8C5H4_CAFRO|nr:hypothetical protein FNF28_07581 [Cafeteria roenbergensis]
MSEKRAREEAPGVGGDAAGLPAKRPHEADEPTCPFLHTVDRSRLDFDAQHVCSVTMSPVNVYACLVCGSFFRGKSATTPAHAHSLDSGHQVFMRLKDGTAWCLPDGYAVRDPSLNDIRMALLPLLSTSRLRRPR